MFTEYWMVLNDSTDHTSYKHESEESAREEAERLAIANPGKTFVVLKAISKVKVNSVVWEKSTPDLPF